MQLKSDRLDLVDALRGFALLAIVLLHNLEHFNLYIFPEYFPSWLKSLDGIIWNTSFFIMAGKAFSTFAMLFGFSFFIQFDNAEKRGSDFRLRFAWRMVILILFALFHSLFYNGDILFLYAVMGLILIPFSRASNKIILYSAIILALQPYELGRIIYALFTPDFVLVGNWNGAYWQPIQEVMKSGSYLEVIKSNITEGLIWNNLWQIEDGRVFKIASLFLFGTLLGRLGYFVKSDESKKFWVKVLLWSLGAIIPLYILQTFIGKADIIDNPSILMPLKISILSYYNFAFMSILVSGFSLLWFYKGSGYKFQRFIIPYGRMSLTNYITQSIVGCFIYLGYGLGLYKHTGATFCIFIGLCIFVLQLLFSRWWLSRYKQGPLEWVWKKLTWLKR